VRVFTSKNRSMARPWNSRGEQRSTEDRRAVSELLGLRIQVLWRHLKKEPAAFWLYLIYLVFEYLRPQAIYPAIAVLPWGQAMLLACLGAVLLGRKYRRPFHPIDGLIIAFFTWTVFSGFFAIRPDESWDAWEGAASWALLYFLGTHILLTRTRLFLFWLGFFVINLKMSQHGARGFVLRGFSFADWGVTGSPGWFQNSGEFAMQMVGIMVLSWCFFMALRPYLSKRKLLVLLAIFPGTAVLSVVASSSRGGQLAAAVVLLALALVHRVRFRTFVALGIAFWIGWIILPSEQKARFETMGTDDTSVERLTLWGEARDLAAENPLFGIGYSNWEVHLRSQGLRPVEVHNTVLEAASELGYPGAALFLALVLVTFLTNRKTRRVARGLGEWGRVFRGMALGLDLALLGFFVAGQFMSVLFYPIFWMIFAMSASLSLVSDGSQRTQGRQQWAHAQQTRRVHERQRAVNEPVLPL